MDAHTRQIAVLFAGAAVGGTYLSGYEWLRFFTYFGAWGIIGIVLTALGLAWFGSTVLSFCHRNQIGSLHDLYVRWFGDSLAPGFTALTYFLLLGYAGVVTGSHVLQVTGGVFTWFFLLLVLLAAGILVLRGWDWLVSSASITLAAGLLLFALLFLEQRHVPIPSLGYQLNGYWLLHALSYLGLHCLLCLVVTIPLASHARSEHALRWGTYLGSAVFFAFALLGQAVLLGHWHDVHTSPSPVAAILNQFSAVASWLHTLLSVLHAAVIVAALVYGLSLPVSIRHNLQLLPLVLVIFGCLLVFALLATVLPWSFTLVATGTTYCGFLLMLGALYRHFKTP